MYEKHFKAVGTLTAFLLRQQRFKIMIWLVSLIGVNVAVAGAYLSIYNDEAARIAAALTMDNPAMVAMLGPGYQTEDFVASIGPLFANEMLLFNAIAVAIMSILLVGQATRGDEEDGRTEMIRALSVGRLSHTSAVMIVNIATNMTLAIGIGVSLAFVGIDGMDFNSSLLYGSTLGATGLIFGAITAVFAQLSESVRGTTMFAFIVLTGAYILRAIGDVSNDALSWLSPLGLTVRTGVFVENSWWPVVLLCLVALGLGIIAFYLQSIRDVGAGFIASKKGRAQASAFLQTPFGFNIWLQKTNIIVWAIIMFALCAAFGAIIGDLEAYYAEIDMLESFFTLETDDTMTEQFVPLIIGVMSLIGVVPVVMTILKLKSEESKNLTENIFSRAVSRKRILGSYLLLAIVVSFIMQTMIALGLWSASQPVMEHALSFKATFIAAYVFLPAIWVMVGLAVGLVGLTPKFTSIIWLYFTYCFIVMYLSDLLQFPDWMNRLSIFAYIPQIPIDDINVVTMIVITVIAVGFTIIGFIGFRERDLIG